MVSRDERRWVWAYAVAFMLLTTVPYLLAFQAQSEQWVFSGFLFGVDDGNSYLAKMMSGYSGDWLFRSTYTNFPQAGLFINQAYLLLGKLTAPPAQHIQMVALFHLFRFLGGLLACLASYDFIAVFVAELRLRRWGLVAATLGGGLGWLLVLLGKPGWLGSLPLDFYSPETFGFLSYYGLPHLAMARALLLWGLVRYITPQPGPSGWPELWQPDRRGIGSGLLWLGLGLMQPMSMLVAWGVLGVHLGISGLLAWRSHDPGSISVWRGYARRGGWAVLVSAPLLLYTVFSFARDPFAQVWTGQNDLPSPHPLHYLLAYGWLLPWALWGAWRLLKSEPWLGWLPAGWLLALPLWVYLPVSVQRRLAEGAWVALVALVCYGLAQVRWRPVLLRSLVMAPVLLTSLVLLAGGMSQAQHPAEPVFLPAEEARLLTEMGEVVPANEVVLATFGSGNLLPAWAPVRVLIGHGPESINLAQLEGQVAQFYNANTSDAWRQEFLAEHEIRYVYYGPHEAELGDWRPDSALYLQLALENGAYSLYKVSQP